MTNKRYSAKRWFTGILATALVATSIPTAAFASEIEPAVSDEDVITQDALNAVEHTLSFDYIPETVSVSTSENMAISPRQEISVSEGNIFQFKAEPEPAYELNYVRIGDTDLTKEEVLYSTGEIRGETLVTVSANKKPVVKFRTEGVSDVTYSLSENGAQPSISVWSSGDITAKSGTEFEIKEVTPAQGYVRADATVKLGESDFGFNTPMTLNANTETTFDIACRKAKVTVSVDNIPDTYENARVELGGVGDGDSLGSESISAYITPATGRSIGSVQYRIGSGNPVEITSSGSMYQIPITAVNSAKEGCCDITLLVSTYETTNGITIEGFDENKTAQQDAGTSKSYAVTLNGGVFDTVDIETISGNNCSVTLDKTSGTLNVDTIKDGKLTSEDIVVRFTQQGKELGDYTIKPAAPTLANPSMTLKRATDVFFEFDTTVPEAEKNIGNLYYEITATAADPSNINKVMKKEATVYAPVSESSAILYVSDAGEGNGVQTTYNVTARLVQIKDDSVSFEETNLNTKGAALRTQSFTTKRPAFESNLKLTKKKTTFISGEKNIELATAVFSSDITYDYLVDAVLSVTNKYGYTENYHLVTGDPDDVENGNILKISEDGKTVLATDTSSVYVGKGTLTVTAKGSSDFPAVKASVPVTVNARLYDISIDRKAASSLYKADNKTASMTFKATGWKNDDSKKKISSPKVKWLILDKDGTEINDNSGHYLSKAISIKNGKVTVAKTWSPSSNEIDNQFKVKAVADDYEGATLSDESGLVTITSGVTKADSIVIAGDPADTAKTNVPVSDKVSSKNVEGKYIVAVDNEKKTIATKDLILTYPAASISVETAEKGWKITEIKKAGNINLTVKSADGKNAKKLTLKIKQGEVTGYNLFINEEKASGTYENIYNAIRASTSAVADSICANKSTIKILSGGRIVEKFSNHELFILPTAENTVLQMSWSGHEPQIYTVHNSIYVGTGSYTVTAADPVIYTGVDADINLTFTGEFDSTKEYMIGLLPDTEVNNWNSYEKFMYSLHINERSSMIDGTTLNGILSSDGNSNKKAKPGDYKVKVVIASGSLETGTISWVSKPMDVTITVKKAPAKPKVSLKTSYTMLINQEQVELTANTTPKEVTPDFTALYNNNNKGTINAFTSYFTLVKDGGKYYIRLRDDLNESQKKMFREGTIPKSDLIGWVSYTATNEAGVTTEGTVKITLTLKK